MKHFKNTLWLALFFCTIAVVNAQRKKASPEKKEFQIVKYNNPGLEVDLGVGLYGHPIPVDYDGDGDMDLLVNSPNKPYYGVYLFENVSGEDIPVFAKPRLLGEGIKSFSVSYMEGKGEPVVFMKREELTDFRKSLDKKTKEVDIAHDSGHIGYVDYDGDGDKDIFVGVSDWSDYGWDNAFNEKGEWTRGPLHGYVILYKNENGKYVNQGKIQAGGKDIDTYGMPTPNFADFDGDGDLDIICGEFMDKLTWFENTGTRENPEYAEGRRLTDSGGTEIRLDLQKIYPVAFDWDRDGHTDLLVGDEDGRVALIRNTGEVKDNMPVFEAPFYLKQEADDLKFGVLATPYSVDWDNDGDEDLIVGNSAGQIGFIENLGGNPPKWAAPVLLESEGKPIRILAGENGSIQGPAEAKWGYTVLSVEDWDGDGLKDIVVNSIWGNIEWYKNTGTPTAPRLSERKKVKIDWQGAPRKPEWVWWTPEANDLVTQWRTTPYMTDWNKDGLMDLIMLDHEGYLAYFERFKNKQGELMLKPGERIFYGVNGVAYNSWNRLMSEKDEQGLLQLNSEKYGKSGRRKFTIMDWDNDGDPDFVLNALNAVIYENVKEEDGNVYLKNIERVTNLRLAGHTSNPTKVIWGDEEEPYLLIGASDGHFYVYKR
ncbi:FG-GAP repeat domain-containing protein [Sinomicrobium soli]|uniref:FG-GAP repeat domain-containing protein n=1 Tax=Sinomicrobium sp. N-1-3-6 TaxID=2219864 RepID=UPI000DCC6EAB|nr:VCBS repeat-containing protein [Sinomicrobium sp. N-1-3-6]RAV30342.1 VCBS repeat-containing protein [Sinomicrobium sp. N-1-3-6]